VLYQFRDGGDLEDFRRKWERSGKSVSETFVWHVLGTLVSVIAFLHSGWSDKEKRFYAALEALEGSVP
jgi:hypothetical protein